MAEQLFVIDGSAFAYRSYFAVRGLATRNGQPTNAVFGFARVLVKILREHAPSHFAVVFDAPGKTFRDELYSEYKATREAMPEDLVSQLPLLDELIDAFNIPLIRIDGVEADDVLGTLARQAEAKSLETVLVTGDKDVLQLVTGKIKAFDPYKDSAGKWYDPAAVEERFGVPPAQLIQMLGLMGDTSDNIPGVKGVGEKTAAKLIQQYGTIEEIYAHLDEIKGKLRERLAQDREQAFLSRQLVTIQTDLDLDIELDDLRRREPGQDKLLALFTRLEFQSLASELAPEAHETEALEYVCVRDEETLCAVIEEMRAAGRFAIDTETTSTDQMCAELVGISLCCRAGRAYYVPVGHTAEAMGGGEAPRVPRERALDLLRPLLDDASVGKIGHNIKYDLVVLRRSGVALEGIVLDTMVASYLTDPSRVRHNLDDVSLHYLKRKLIPIADLIGKGTNAITFDQVPVSRAAEYACEDADITWRLGQLFEAALRDRGVEALFNEVELPLIGVLARMEMAGIAIDLKVFDSLRRELKTRLQALESEIHACAGQPFQINSPKQLQDILFNKLGLKPLRRTKTGHSTDVEVLERLAHEHPLPRLILEYRTLDKLRGTYVEALPKLVHPATGRIHTSFNQAVAATGRLSSSDPNLQNIPVRSEIGRRIREGFVPGQPGFRLISADYSQIELRILAHLSGDAGLIEAFRQDTDIHQETAVRLFGVLPELVTAEMRRQAKAVNFGVVYGISPYGLAQNLGISNAEAARFIEQYFEQFPGVRVWIEQTLDEARRRGYVTTLLQRRRYVPELNSRDNSTRRGAERIAINTPVQGSAADIIKLAMVQLDAALEGAPAQMLLQVHDELLVEAPAGGAESVAQTVRTVMEGAMELNVALKVEVGIGNNWAEVH